MSLRSCLTSSFSIPFLPSLEGRLKGGVKPHTWKLLRGSWREHSLPAKEQNLFESAPSTHICPAACKPTPLILRLHNKQAYISLCALDKYEEQER